MVNITGALVVVMAINVMLFLGQASISGISDEANQTLFNCQGSILGGFDSNNCNGSYVLDTTNINGTLPQKVTSATDEGNIFTDIFGSIKTWFLDTTGLSYAIDIISAPNKFLTAIGLPGAFSFALAAMWYGITIFLLVAFFWGRNA